MESRSFHGSGQPEEAVRRTAIGASFDDPPDADEAYEPLTRQQAQALRERLPRFSPWHVVTGQALTGLVLIAIWGVVTQSAPAIWSALYGAVAVVVPQAVMAWGITRRRTDRPHELIWQLAVWELIKIGGVVAILVAAPWVVPRLSWPAMLVSFVVCIKAGWLSLLFKRKPTTVSGREERLS